MSKLQAPTRKTAQSERIRSDVEVRLTTRLTESIESHKQAITKFAAEVVQNPFNTLSWSLDVFKTAAELHVLQELASWIDNNNTGWKALEPFHEHCKKYALNKARSAANKSTSQTSNLADENLLGAYASFPDDWNFSQYYVQHLAEAPTTPEEAEAQRDAKQAEYNAEYAKALDEYEQARNAERIAKKMARAANKINW